MTGQTRVKRERRGERVEDRLALAGKQPVAPESEGKQPVAPGNGESAPEVERPPASLCRPVGAFGISLSPRFLGPTPQAQTS